MSHREHEIYDVVGIGFGPSNLSLAIALQEYRTSGLDKEVSALFLERQSSFGWHRDMLLPSATMQISFLKDLVTFRNPTSSFSFIAFLHASGRLPQFVNNQDFFPTREEFHQYLEWAQARVADDVVYGSEVTSIRLVRGDAPETDRLRLQVADGARQAGRGVEARNVVVSTGLVPSMPEGTERDERVWHSSEFLEKYRRTDPSRLRRVTVVGAGQSAAEITRFLYDELPHAEVYSVIPSYGYSVADDTPFANQVFDPGAVDDYYFGTERTREAFWRYHRNTNYSVVDDEVIRDLYRRAYGDDVRGVERLHFLSLTRVTGVKRVGAETRVSLQVGPDAEVRELDCDAVVCATGYSGMEPTGLLGDLDRYCVRDAAGRYRVERDYSVVTDPELRCGIYLQGGTEHSHGLTSSLLSNIAVRSGEIADSIVARRAEWNAACPISVPAEVGGDLY
ncbi:MULTISPECIES: lysine N(6)-hydroxylase/L-ornithine N(5)-oxygenase family protein [unclassified Streptomyces]|uniref:lysine N(6)-hydroxylase/L-ornithine N(5)-oxygenase family protein n=1 Tax=unclassified Streptomyces TaxID=2593676 RepID=UPI001F04FEA4|nr:MULTISPECIES: lysine N(6)-hydroxylase/L-ornithine N(5)-oxygenase family protein [unclassified Streptomyces]MCH0564630.1 lysine N(6)-hydroxylase/L-ornithine N(5)-oxygenase family protein [Streptomyces sp. MUM 2J]MCH0570330.1 lysine N(6)-hydroxylase/L-ornithine N(5)-oxygenase family protein [Streptomyces sp. MUM 136J]